MVEKYLEISNVFVLFLSKKQKKTDDVLRTSNQKFISVCEFKLPYQKSGGLHYETCPGYELEGSCQFDFCPIGARIVFWLIHTCHTLHTLKSHYTS